MKVVSDSTADLNQSIVDEYQIEIVPLKVHFGEEEFLDWVEMRGEDFYQKLTLSDILPRTSQPSPAEFVKTYEELGPNETIFSIHISSGLSGTYQSAMMAKNMLPDRDIHVINTRLASMAHGGIVFEAARAVKAGRSKEEVLKVINTLKSNLKVYFVVDTLEYLQKNGRIGRAQALLGSLLKVKPILTLKDGIVTPKEKARGRGKAVNRIIEICKEEFTTEKLVNAFVLHSNAPEEALKLQEKVIENFNVEEIAISSIGAVIGTHVGPGTLGVVMYHKNI